MKAYLTTIGELTTDICKKQLERFGYEVIVLGGIEAWPDKYKRFIETANEDCIRIDADIVPNENIKEIAGEVIHKTKILGEKILMMQFHCYDFYKNMIGISSPVYYSKEALEIIRKNLKQVDMRRPEANAWRLPQINEFTHTSQKVVGLHGFFQDEAAYFRAMQNKIDRRQMHLYDFQLAEQLMKVQKYG